MITIRGTMQDIKNRLLVHEAKRWIGFREVGGDNRGQVVELFQKAVDGKAQGEAWCLAFIQFCAMMVDSIYDEFLLSSNPKTILFKTEHCMTLWENSKSNRVTVPFIGCIVIWQMWKDGKPTQSGHAGIVAEVLANGDIMTIEGNTSDSSGIDRDGDGVYMKKRSILGGPTMKIVGFLKAWQ